MPSILSVTMNPPITFTIARATAKAPRVYDKSGIGLKIIAVAVNAPKTVIPESAFIPDISGV